MRFASKACAVFATTGLALGLATMPARAEAAPVACDVPALKAAIVAANMSGGTLDLSRKCVYTLTAAHDGVNGLPVITNNVTINGNFATIERQSADLFRLFEVAPGARLTLRGITLRKGDLNASADGGAVLVDAGGRLDVRGSSIRENTARNGGGIFTAGSTSANGSSISENTATGFGGGIGVGGPSGSLTMNGSAVTGNEGNFSGGLGFDFGTTGMIQATAINNNKANVNGGGLANDGTLTVRASQFIGNKAGGDGGGLANDRSVTIVNSTFYANTANRGGGVANFNAPSQPTATATINTSIIVGNVANTTAGGVFNSVGTTTLTRSVVVANTPNNCLGSTPPVNGCVG
ncbi:hypothetical protein ACFXJ8_22685 [Nonomuraea sp. NPDC059194]|uniref:hypothetical protein n=1 Tax=Nonomuraea sp. NPDC059194 TaxID=3346764 RepID=UPI0036C118E7